MNDNELNERIDTLAARLNDAVRDSRLILRSGQARYTALKDSLEARIGAIEKMISRGDVTENVVNGAIMEIQADVADLWAELRELAAGEEEP